MEIKIENDKLIITVDVSKEAIAAARISSAGKSKLVASTGGFIPINDSGGIKAGLNVTAPLDR